MQPFNNVTLKRHSNVRVVYFQRRYYSCVENYVKYKDEKAEFLRHWKRALAQSTTRKLSENYQRLVTPNSAL